MFCKQLIRLLQISSKPQGIPKNAKKTIPNQQNRIFRLHKLHLIFRTPCSFHGYQVLGHALQHLLMWKIHYCNQIRGIVQGEFLNDVETILASFSALPCDPFFGRSLRLDGAQMGIDGWNSFSKKENIPNKKLTQLRFFLVLSFLSSIGMEEIWKGKERHEMDASLGCHPTYRSSDL